MISLMAVPRSSLLVAVVLAGVLAAGCGSGGAGNLAKPRPRPALPPRPARGPGPRASEGPPGGSGAQTIPAPGPTGIPADPAAVSVIRAWSSALRRGDVRGAARYFGVPSVFINGPDAAGVVPVIVIRTEAEAQAINATLPCGAVLLSSDQRGRYINALFRLTDRPGLGGGCGAGIGQVARTNFVVSGGRIVRWIRAPSDPSDHAPPAPAAPPGKPVPAAPPSPGPVI